MDYLAKDEIILTNKKEVKAQGTLICVCKYIVRKKCFAFLPEASVWGATTCKVDASGSLCG
ncbi:MAG: hypothetical protein AB8F74_17915 [Saprospiraceae bacterium]